MGSGIIEAVVNHVKLLTCTSKENRYEFLQDLFSNNAKESVNHVLVAHYCEIPSGCLLQISERPLELYTHEFMKYFCGITNWPEKQQL